MSGGVENFSHRIFIRRQQLPGRRWEHDYGGDAIIIANAAVIVSLDDGPPG
jgi:hypothetical protein